ncbi:Endochitinase [Thalictrum thalictroides]|uniref:Endochitinase n=1 Tax=Thalictrum thalictroides TaxID=46969 RepID=A0A7J6UTI7_THATH|nr:Endochitinase [Thalictrum thalictroides]
METIQCRHDQSGRVRGFGTLSNIINGGIECGKGSSPEVADRMRFYRRYCGILGVVPSDNWIAINKCRLIEAVLLNYVTI